MQLYSNSYPISYPTGRARPEKPNEHRPIVSRAAYSKTVSAEFLGLPPATPVIARFCEPRGRSGLVPARRGDGITIVA